MKKNKPPLVSIIVPVYNTPDEYLWKSLDSIEAQSYLNLEIIVVNDGSKNKITRALDRYVDKTKRNSVHKWKIIHKANGGLSSARNSGYEISTGKYIQFLDSDDFFNKNLIKEAVEIAEKTEADIVVENFEVINTKNKVNTGIVIDKKNLPKTKLFSLEDIKGSEIGIIPFNVWSKLFNKKFLDKKNIKHDEELHRCEDVLFSYSALFQTNKISFLDKPYIKYNEAITTSNSSRNDKYPIDSIKAWKKLFNKLLKSKKYNIYTESFEKSMVGSIYWHLERMNTKTGVEKLSKEFMCFKNEVNLNIKNEQLIGLAIASLDTELWFIYKDSYCRWMTTASDLTMANQKLEEILLELNTLKNPGIKSALKNLIDAIKRKIKYW